MRIAKKVIVHGAKSAPCVAKSHQPGRFHEKTTLKITQTLKIGAFSQHLALNTS
jgi:hypothetical protein